jgi:hypothetical protein
MKISRFSKSYGVIVPIVALCAFIPYEVVSHQAVQPGRGTGRGSAPPQNPGPPPGPPAAGQPRGGYRGAATAAGRNSPRTARVAEDVGNGRARKAISRATHRATRPVIHHPNRRQHLQPRRRPRPRRRGTIAVHALRLRAAEDARAVRRLPEMRPKRRRQLRGQTSRIADREWKARCRPVPWRRAPALIGTCTPGVPAINARCCQAAAPSSAMPTAGR